MSGAGAVTTRWRERVLELVALLVMTGAGASMGENTAGGFEGGAGAGAGAGASDALTAASNFDCKLCTLRFSDSILLFSFFFSFNMLEAMLVQFHTARQNHVLDELVIVLLNL